MLGSRTHYLLLTRTTTLVAEVAAGKAATLSPGERADWGFDFTDAVLLGE